MSLQTSLPKGPRRPPRGRITPVLITALLLAGCSAPLGLSESGGLPAQDALPTEAPTSPPAPTTSATPTAEVTVEPTLAATASALNSGATSTPIPSPESGIAPDTAPRPGSFDVYLEAPDETGVQRLKWINTVSGEAETEIAIRADDQDIVRAGQFVYFHAPGTREAQRANTAGAIQTIGFASPAPGASYYQFLPSATGSFAAWVSVDASNVFRISFAASDGTGARQVGGDTLLPGEMIRLLRVTNDGRRVFYERRPGDVMHQTLFNARYDLYMLEIATSRVVHLPGEPACGAALLCDAHISGDGAYLVRTLPSSISDQPVVVTNLTTGGTVAQFAPIGIPAGAAFEIGYPYLTPGGELIYEQAYGPSGLEQYELVWANLVTGEQRILANLGTERHRPLGWAADGITLLTTREPVRYDTWQINVETGTIRQIAGMLFLGHIEEPPLTP